MLTVVPALALEGAEKERRMDKSLEGPGKKKSSDEDFGIRGF